MATTLGEFWAGDRGRPHCHGCGAPLLLAGERKVDVADRLPNARKLGADGMCSTCYQRGLREGRLTAVRDRPRPPQAPRPRITTGPPVPFPELDGTQACADADPELFFPYDSEDPSAAKSICSRCPLRRPCLAFALTRDVEGIWGGTTSEDRRRLRRKHGVGTVPFPTGPPARTTTTTTTTGLDEPTDDWSDS